MRVHRTALRTTLTRGHQQGVPETRGLDPMGRKRPLKQSGTCLPVDNLVFGVLKHPHRAFTPTHLDRKVCAHRRPQLGPVDDKTA